VKATGYRPVSSLKFEKTSFHYPGVKVFSGLLSPSIAKGKERHKPFILVKPLV
jgi:hypothetical protein